MKKALLLTGLLLVTLSGQAQLTVSVMQPSSLVGLLEFTSATWANTPDMTVPGFQVQGFAAIVDDGTAADSLGCGSLVNGDLIAGKIAIVYRGACEFGEKALNAANAGAIAVVIVNNVGGPVGMAAGAVGDEVNVPVVMISSQAGADLRSEVLAGNVELLIANLSGQLSTNLAILPIGVLAPPSSGTSALLTQNANELIVDLGSWVYNKGSQAISTVRLHTTVEFNGDTIYENISLDASVAAGDSIWVDAPAFTQSNFAPGRYVIRYTAVSDEEDQFPVDNVISMAMHIGNVFTYAQPEPVTGYPIASTYTTSADPDNTTTCIHFNNANAGRVIAMGMMVRASTGNIDTPLGDEVAEVTANLWTDDLSGGPNTLPSENGLSILSQGLHVFTEAERLQPVYVPFDLPVLLENGESYLFCMEAFGMNIHHGFNRAITFDRHMENYGSPVSLLRNAGEWFNGFADFDAVPSLGVVLVDATSIGMNETDNRVEIVPYPNPAVDVLRIPVNGMNGAATLEVFDVAGAKVAEQRVSVGGDRILEVNVGAIANGTYMFHMNFEDGKQSSFRVVVAK